VNVKECSVEAQGRLENKYSAGKVEYSQLRINRKQKKQYSLSRMNEKRQEMK